MRFYSFWWTGDLYKLARCNNHVKTSFCARRFITRRRSSAVRDSIIGDAFNSRERGSERVGNQEHEQQPVLDKEPHRGSIASECNNIAYSSWWRLIVAKRYQVLWFLLRFLLWLTRQLPIICCAFYFVFLRFRIWRRFYIFCKSFSFRSWSSAHVNFGLSNGILIVRCGRWGCGVCSFGFRCWGSRDGRKSF